MTRQQDSKFTRIVIARDKVCQECGSTENLQAHHIIPVSAGGDDHPSNGITLCPECHAKRHPKLSRELFTHWVGHRKMEWLNFRVSSTLLAEIEAENRKRNDKSLSKTVRYLMTLGLKEYERRYAAWLQFMSQYHFQKWT